MFERHIETLPAIAMSIDSGKIVSCGLDDTVHVWSMETGQVMARLLAVCMHKLASMLDCLIAGAQGARGSYLSFEWCRHIGRRRQDCVGRFRRDRAGLEHGDWPGACSLA